MAKPRMFLCRCLITTVALAGLAVAADSGPDRPARFLPDLDREFVQVANPLNGTTWAAWTYSNGSETDIALSHRDADGLWSQVQRIGLEDLESQRQPALSVDEHGTTYLVYAEVGTGRIFVTARGLDAREWTTPAAVSPVGVVAAAPAAMIAANRKLVIGYIVDDRINLRELPLLPPVVLGFGNDGPDPVGGMIWPPEVVDDTDYGNDMPGDGLIGGGPVDHELMFTGDSARRKTPRN